MQYLNYVEVDGDACIVDQDKNSVHQSRYEHVHQLRYSECIFINHMQYLNYVEVDWDDVLLIKIKVLYISQDIVNMYISGDIVNVSLSTTCSISIT